MSGVALGGAPRRSLKLAQTWVKDHSPFSPRCAVYGGDAGRERAACCWKPCNEGGQAVAAEARAHRPDRVIARGAHALRDDSGTSSIGSPVGHLDEVVQYDHNRARSAARSATSADAAS